jgi:phosphatidate phosphatase APP1
VKKWLGILSPLRIDVYLGYAGRNRAIVRGRALENEVPRPPRASDRWHDNLRRALRQLESDEVPGLSLRVALAGRELAATTDDEGYFHLDFPLPEPLPTGWHPAKVRVTDATLDAALGVEGLGRVLVPSEGARFGVISDIDDTILQSHVQDRLRQVRLTLLGNAVTRLSFEGTGDLFRGMARAGSDAPVFYVSRSAWNLHAVLEHFIERQGLPRGPLVLRDLALPPWSQSQRHHKQREIERILEMYPGVSFVMIGDSGQRDPQIYRDLCVRHPDQVEAILIRDVTPGKTSAAEVLRDGDLARPWLVFEDGREAIEFCRKHGLWVDPRAPEPGPGSWRSNARAGA